MGEGYDAGVVPSPTRSLIRATGWCWLGIGSTRMDVGGRIEKRCESNGTCGVSRQSGGTRRKPRKRGNTGSCSILITRLRPQARRRCPSGSSELAIHLLGSHHTNGYQDALRREGLLETWPRRRDISQHPFLVPLMLHWWPVPGRRVCPNGNIWGPSSKL